MKNAILGFLLLAILCCAEPFADWFAANTGEWPFWVLLCSLASCGIGGMIYLVVKAFKN